MNGRGGGHCARREPEGNLGKRAECTHRMRLRSVRARSAPMRSARNAHRVYLRSAVAGSVAARTWYLSTREAARNGGERRDNKN